MSAMLKRKVHQATSREQSGNTRNLMHATQKVGASLNQTVNLGYFGNLARKSMLDTTLQPDYDEHNESVNIHETSQANILDTTMWSINGANYPHNESFSFPGK